MTDTLSSDTHSTGTHSTGVEIAPITEPHLTPMFATGSRPVVSNTQPHPAPIFDTGPHPDPLRAAETTGAETVARETVGAEMIILESHAPATEYAMAVVSEAAPISEAVPEPVSEPVVEPLPEAVPELDAELASVAEPQPFSQAFSELENVDTDTFLRTVNGHVLPATGPAQPIVVPSSYLFVKRWKFALIVAGVWLLAAGAGLGCYYWWYTSLDKTLPVFGILVFIGGCAVAGILVSLVPDRPQVTGLAIALMSAPLAATAAAAVLHGAYFFEWVARPIIG